MKRNRNIMDIIMEVTGADLFSLYMFLFSIGVIATFAVAKLYMEVAN